MTQQRQCLCPGLVVSRFHDRGERGPRYLVQVGDRSFSVAEGMGNLLLAWQQHGHPLLLDPPRREAVLPGLDDAMIQSAIARLPAAFFPAPDGPPPAEPGAALWFRLPLLSARRTAGLARVFVPLFRGPIARCVAPVTLLALPGLVWLTLALEPAALRPSDALVASSLFFLGILIHELGHAAALGAQGVMPGAIGFGLYHIAPAFYADVNAAWRLPPRDRAIVDIGGIYLQLLYVVGLGPVLLLLNQTTPFKWLVLASLGHVLFNLNPLFKTDGYWLLCDLGGWPNLHTKLARLLGNLRRLGEGGPLARLGLVVVYGGLGAGLIALVGFVGAKLLQRLVLANLDQAVEQAVQLAAGPTVGGWGNQPVSLAWLLFHAGMAVATAAMLGIWGVRFVRRLWRALQPVPPAQP